jgi:hypothetical protein
LAALHYATVDLLTAAIPQATHLTCIKILVEQITYSWKDITGNVLCICTPAKLEECLALAIDAQTTKFVLIAHCDLIYFAHNFDGLDLDKANTTPFPSTRSTSSGTPTVLPPVLSTMPPMDTFNYKALPLQVHNRFYDQQDPKKVTCPSNTTKYF